MTAPVAYRIHQGKMWHYLDDSTPFPTQGCDPLYSKAQLDQAADEAYKERNILVALLSKLYPSGKAKTAIPGWDEAWHGCVFIDFPWGQASWHFHERDAYLFEHLPNYHGQWDGHSTVEKYAKIVAARPGTVDEQRRTAYEQALDLGSPFHKTRTTPLN